MKPRHVLQRAATYDLPMSRFASRLIAAQLPCSVPSRHRQPVTNKPEPHLGGRVAKPGSQAGTASLCVVLPPSVTLKILQPSPFRRAIVLGLRLKP